MNIVYRNETLHSNSTSGFKAKQKNSYNWDYQKVSSDYGHSQDMVFLNVSTDYRKNISNDLNQFEERVGKFF